MGARAGGHELRDELCFFRFFGLLCFHYFSFVIWYGAKITAVGERVKLGNIMEASKKLMNGALRHASCLTEVTMCLIFLEIYAVILHRSKYSSLISSH